MKAKLLLVTVVVWGAVLRLYHAPNYFKFDYEQANDVVVTRDLWEKVWGSRWQELPLKGQEGTHIPEQPVPGLQIPFNNPVYNGVFYYFLLMPFGVLTNFHPFGVTLFFILTSILSIYLIYLVGKEIFDQKTGLVAAFLTANNYLISLYGRWIWTPSLMPFLVTLSSLGLVRLVKRDYRFQNWLMLVFGGAAASQVHFSGYWFLGFSLLMLFIFRPKLKKLFFWQKSVLLFIILLIIGPSLIYELLSGFKAEGAIFEQMFRHVRQMSLAQLFLTLGGEPITWVRAVLSLDVGRQKLSLVLTVIGLWATGETLTYLWRLKERRVKPLLYGLLLFMPMPWLLYIYFLPWSFSLINRLNSLLTAIPLLLIILARWVVIKLDQRGYQALIAVFFVIAVSFHNWLNIKDFLWTNQKKILNYGPLVEVSAVIAKHADGQPYSLDFDWKMDMDNFLYVLEVNDYPLPQRFNDKNHWSILKNPLNNGEVQKHYTAVFESNQLSEKGELIYDKNGYQIYFQFKQL